MGDLNGGKGYPEPLSMTTAGREGERSMRKRETVVVMVSVERGSAREIRE